MLLTASYLAGSGRFLCDNGVLGTLLRVDDKVLGLLIDF